MSARSQKFFWIAGALVAGALIWLLGHYGTYYALRLGEAARYRSAIVMRALDSKQGNDWPSEFRPRSSRDYADALVAEGYLKPGEEKSMLDHFVVLNVGDGDASDTALLVSRDYFDRRRPFYVVVTKNGKTSVQLLSRPLVLPKSTPQFLP